MEEFIPNKKESSYYNFGKSFNEKLTLDFAITNCRKGFYYKIEIINKDKTLGNFDTFETQSIKCNEENSEIKFEEKLNCNYYFNKIQLMIILIKKGISVNSTIMYKQYKRITVLSSLITSLNSIYERRLKEKEEDSEKIIIKLNKEISINNSLSNELSIFDIIRMGINLSCYISYNVPCLQCNYNNFELFLKKFSDFILNYTYNHLFNMYGIEGELKTIKNFENIFDINNSYLDSYNSYSNQISPNNSKFLSTLLDKVNTELNNKQQVDSYNILFIFLKESVNLSEIKNSIDIIIESSYLPLTIIIIGDSQNDFDEMNYDINNIPNISSNGMQKMRKNAKFFLLGNNHENNIEYVIDKCLKEIAIQMLNFYKLIKLTPNDTKQNNHQKIKNSLSYFSSSIKDSHLYSLKNHKNELKNESLPDNPIIDESNNIKESNNILNSNQSKIFDEHPNRNVNNKNTNNISIPRTNSNEINISNKNIEKKEKNSTKSNYNFELMEKIYVNKKLESYDLSEEENKNEEKNKEDSKNEDNENEGKVIEENINKEKLKEGITNEEDKNEENNNNNNIIILIKENDDDSVKRMLQDSFFNNNENMPNQYNKYNLKNDNNNSNNVGFNYNIYKKEEKNENNIFINNISKNNNNDNNNILIKEDDDDDDNPIKRMLKDSFCYNGEIVNNQYNNYDLKNENINSNNGGINYNIYKQENNEDNIFKNNISIDMIKGKKNSEVDELASTANSKFNKESNYYI